MPSIDDVDLVADLHRADTLGGAGEDDVAGQQRHDAGDVRHEPGTSKIRSLVVPSCLRSPLR